MEQQTPEELSWQRNHVSHLFESQIFDKATDEFGAPDVDFRAGPRSFKVHKKALENQSSVLKAKLSHVWQTSGDVLQLDEKYVEPAIVEELLTWMYYTNANKDWRCSTENAYSVCVAAHYLMMPKLVDSCREILRYNITLESFYDLYTLSKHLNFDDLRQACENSIMNIPSDFLLSPHVIEWTIEELKMFIKKLFQKDRSCPKVRGIIFLSLAIWADASFEDRLRAIELENLLDFPPPEALSSDGLFRFMKTELYSRLDEWRRKQYYVRSYLPTGIRSTDKLYCISWRQDGVRSWLNNVHCLDLSVGDEFCLLSQQEITYEKPVLGVLWRKKIYFFDTRNLKPITVFSTKTDEWLPFELEKPSGGHYLLSGVALDGYIYITGNEKPEVAGRSVERFSLKTKQWKTLEDMQTARLAHQLVALDGLIYAIGGEVPDYGPTNNYVHCVKDKNPKKNQLASYLSSTFQKMLGFETAEKMLENPSSHQCEPDRFLGPERYDPRANRWEYIAPSHYHHQLPTAVAYKGQIYVLSKAGFEAYSPKHDQWTRLRVPDLCLRSSLLSIAGSLWLLTELSDPVHSRCRTTKVSRLVYEFDVVKQEWTRLPDLPEVSYSDFAFVVKQ